MILKRARRNLSHSVYRRGSWHFHQALALPTSCAHREILKGFCLRSPGLRGTSYPGWRYGLSDQPRTGLRQCHLRDATPLGLILPSTFSQGRRAARLPWALRQNPFGIHKRPRKMWVMTRLAPTCTRLHQLAQKKFCAVVGRVP